MKGLLFVIFCLLFHQAHAGLVVTYEGRGVPEVRGMWEITTVKGTFDELSATLMSQPWFGGILAKDFSELVAGQLGFPNDKGTKGPIFAWQFDADTISTVGARAVFFPDASEGVNIGVPNTATLTWAVASRVTEPGPGDYVDVTSISDINGNGVPETAALSGRHATILDSATGLWLRNVHFFWHAWSVKAIATLDSDLDGRPELAALGHHNTNGRILVEVKDVTSGDRIGRFRFLAYQDMTPVSLTVGDVDFDGAPDIGVMAVRADGRVAVEYRDAATGEKLPDWIRDKIWFPQN